MYFAVARLDAEKFTKLDFTLNFGITPEVKSQYVEAIENGGDYDEVKREVFDQTPTIMLLKLHKYFNWADKKLHTAFFIDNKDQISDDLLDDFKEGSSLQVNPELISANK